MASGKLVLRAYSPYRDVTWSKTWHESKAGDLGTRAAGICKELESAAVTIMKLAREAEGEAEERRKRWEIEREIYEREEQERRRLEEEARRQKQVQDDIEQWRLAREIREYVDQTIRVVEDAGMRVTPDGSLDLYLRSARSIAERVDPLGRLRDDLVRVAADWGKHVAARQGAAEPATPPLGTAQGRDPPALRVTPPTED